MISNHCVQERVILPLGDILTGQSVSKYLRFLQKSRYWSREEIDRFQNERLRLLITHAYGHVPFYREEMDKLQLTPADIRTKEDLRLLPIVTKAMIKKEGIERFKAAGIPEKSIVQGASSGSTGEPFRYLTTKDDYSVNIAANLRGWYDMGWRLGDRYVKLSQNPRNNPVKRLQDYMTNNLYLATNPLTDENFANVLRQIESYKPRVIRCYPDPLLLLARYKRVHPEFAWSPVAITTTGNTLFPETRKEIEEAWGCKVFYDSRKDIRLAATGSASPIIEDASTDSGTGRWTVIKIPTLSFYEYCQLLQLDDMPLLPDHLKITDIPKMENAEVADLMARFEPLVKHFNRYLTIGGFPELALSDDDLYAQRMLREDVVDKVIKRDVLTLFKVRSPLLMEKLFLYLCMNSTEIFSATTAAKELDNISPNTIESYVDALVKSNLIYMAYPIAVGSKSVLKGRPKIYIADAAIRNAVLMVDDVLSDERELGLLIETTVYKHLVSFYQGTGAQLGYYRKAKENQKEVDAVIELPQQKILCEVKYKNNSHIPQTDGIVELCNDPKAGITDAFVITKQLEDFGVTRHETSPKIYRIPAIAFLYLIGKEESDGMSGRL